MGFDVTEFEQIVANFFDLREVRFDSVERTWVIFRCTGWLTYNRLGRAYPRSSKKDRFKQLESRGLVEILSDFSGTRGFARITDAGREFLRQQQTE